MITRYSRPEMRAIWTDENKLKIWLQIELLASEALVKEGVVPAKDFKKIKAGCDKWFADLPGLVARQRELEKTLNHDVIGFTTAVAEAINDNASRWFHFGLTSSDVGDTCYAVQMMQSRGHPHRRREGGAARHRAPREGTQVHALHRAAATASTANPRRSD
ncbi:MAG: lyase family protein [Verrucomicrobiota bacterium]